MAYATGSIVGTGPIGLLNALASFLVTNGWTQNMLADDNSGYETWDGLDNTGRRLHVQKTASDGTVMYFNLRAINRGLPFQDRYSVSAKFDGTHYRSELSGIGINGSTGYNGSSTWDLQPGYSGVDGTGSGNSSGACLQGLQSNISSYWFFQNGDTVHIVVEYSTGCFGHMIFGCIKKSHTFTGGQFFASMLSSYYAGEYFYNRIDGVYNTRYGVLLHPNMDRPGVGSLFVRVDDVSNWRWEGYAGNNGSLYKNSFIPSGNKTFHISTSSYYIHGASFGSYITSRQPNSFNALSMILPSYCFVRKASGYLVFLGLMEGVNFINCLYHTPGEEITIGLNTFKVFPSLTKDTSEAPSVEYFSYGGVAIKKVV